jgi:hypothetical protein
LCIESQARGPVVGYLGCSKKCYMSEGSTCSNNYCLCKKQEVGSFRHCCDTCVGPLCYCPDNCDMCGWVLVTYIINRVLRILKFMNEIKFSF